MRTAFRLLRVQRKLARKIHKERAGQPLPERFPSTTQISDLAARLTVYFDLSLPAESERQIRPTKTLTLWLVSVGPTSEPFLAKPPATVLEKWRNRLEDSAPNTRPETADPTVVHPE